MKRLRAEETMKGRCRYAGVEQPVDLAELHSTQYLAEAEDAEETMNGGWAVGGGQRTSPMYHQNLGRWTGSQWNPEALHD
jgi:hypothetical protein